LRKVKSGAPLEWYLEQEYPITIYRAEEGGYVAEVEDLPGCISEGDSIEEVYQRIEEAKHLWIQTAFGDGMGIPIPRSDEDYSGRFLTRIPKHLHRRLAEQARREGVSLNQYVETILATFSVKPDEKFERIFKDLLKRALSQIEKSQYMVSYGIPIMRSTWIRAEEEPVAEGRFILQDREEVTAV